MRLKSFMKKIWDNRLILLYVIPFILMDLVIKILFFKNRVYPIWEPSSYLFSMLWIVFFGIIIFSFRGIVRKVIYWILFVISFIFMLANGVYYFKTDYFFSFHLVKMTGEGSEYIWDTIASAKVYFYILSVLVLIVAIIVSRKITRINRIKPKYSIIAVVLLVIIYIFTPRLTIGKEDNYWDSKRNIYNSCTNANKSIEMCGLYEYMTRNFYVSLLKSRGKISEKDKEFLDNEYGKKDIHKHNEYTGLFKGKNIIILQLEGMDSWLLNKNDTPTLYKLKNESIDFCNHFTMYTGGGSTFNSELAANTGFVQPLSTNDFACLYYENNYKNTLPIMLKKIGYDVNAYHMAKANYYYRGYNYKNWGYSNYYSLIDLVNFKDKSYRLDRELILKDSFSNLMFKSKKFADYIITYSPHMPFDMSNEMFQILAKEKYGNNYKKKSKELSEEELVRLSGRESDYMVEKLLDKLKGNGQLKNTVIIAFADHYLYSLVDKSILSKYKKTNNNLINKTPFFIWSSDTRHKKINKTTMQTNVLPTILNLFGINYNVNDFVGEDALDPKYKGVAFFPDYSWYDGNIYVENGIIMNGRKSTHQYVSNMDKKVKRMIKKNDLTLEYNYFGLE